MAGTSEKMLVSLPEEHVKASALRSSAKYVLNDDVHVCLQQLHLFDAGLPACAEQPL